MFTGCRIKVHKEHLEKMEDLIAPCKVNNVLNTAKEMLLLAASAEDQQVSRELDLYSYPRHIFSWHTLVKQWGKDNYSQNWFTFSMTKYIPIKSPVVMTTHV